MKRRNLFQAMAGMALWPAASLVATPADPARQRVLRLAHLTDVHLRDQDQAPAKFTRCLHHLQNLADPVELVLDGGDTIFDALGVADKAQVDAQWRLWETTFRQACDLEVVHCIGNHDVWAGGDKSDPLYGKKYVQDRLGMDRPYYSFDRAGWHFIVLDSTHPVAGGWYTARLDRAQLDWLQADLAATPATTPILVLSHIPILTATAFYPDQVKNGNWEVPGGWMHTDFQAIQQLFLAHGKVKVCLSGHMHLRDWVEYNGITYLCDGAVSGSWWSSPLYHQTPAGYAVINLYADGSFSREWYPYDWT